MKTFRYNRLLITLSILLLCSAYLYAQAGFDRAAYYTAFANGQAAELDEQIKKTSSLSGQERDAFEGALLMRKAGTAFSPAQKLSLFKKGGKKLEAAIKADPQNVEFRFLRLMVQENAPKIVGYKDNIKADSEMVKNSLSSLSKSTQNAVNSYAKKSQYL